MAQGKKHIPAHLQAFQIWYCMNNKHGFILRTLLIRVVRKLPNAVRSVSVPNEHILDNPFGTDREGEVTAQVQRMNRAYSTRYHLDASTSGSYINWKIFEGTIPS